jgi:hypothetical protein
MKNSIRYVQIKLKIFVLILNNKNVSILLKIKKNSVFDLKEYNPTTLNATILYTLNISGSARVLKVILKNLC